MRFGEVKGQPVISVTAAERLGVIDDLLLDTSQHQVLGFRVRRGGLIPHREAVLLQDVRAIGVDAVTVEDAGSLNSDDKFPALHDSVNGGDVIGSRVVTENGRVLGSVSDIDADFSGGAVLGYVVVGGGLMERLRNHDEVIPVAAVRSVGEKLLVVANEIAPEEESTDNPK